ncbi:hypothetical protein QBC45DRAFT_93179 [Copromyces sp. CBS 386.78]|nr:hypothetical protein QBC45DRAFT_93179 [Copromyces sp. CBS 386.78]
MSGGDGWDGWMMCNRSILRRCICLSLASPPLIQHSAVVSGRCRHDIQIHGRATEHSSNGPSGRYVSNSHPREGDHSSTGRSRHDSNIKHEATTTASGNLPHPVSCTYLPYVRMYVDFSGIGVRHPDSRLSQRYGTLRTILLDSSGIEND